jgi:hypothetical protein
MTTTIFSSLTDEQLELLPTQSGALGPATWPEWAAEMQLRKTRVAEALAAEKQKALEAAANAASASPVLEGKPGLTRHGVPCLKYPGFKSEKYPNPHDKEQVDRLAAVLTLPSSQTKVESVTKGNKTTERTSTTNYGHALLIWLPQSMSFGSRGGVKISPEDSYWFASGTKDTKDITESAAYKALDLISDRVECWIQTSHASTDELTPPTAKKVTAEEFIAHARKAMVDFTANAQKAKA